MLGFLNLTWEKLVDPSGDNDFYLATLPIAFDVQGGQFSIRVCSLDCLRSLFSSWVDALEREVNEETGGVPTGGPLV
jgi:hypothetical protein